MEKVPGVDHGQGRTAAALHIEDAKFGERGQLLGKQGYRRRRGRPDGNVAGRHEQARAGHRTGLKQLTSCDAHVWGSISSPAVPP
jgi:hypothetical protein